MCARNTDSRAAEMGSLHLLLIFCKICQVVNVGKISEIIQDSGIRMAKIGENVTLHCSCRDTSVTSFAWFQQSLGTKPHLISSRMKHGPKAEITPLYQKRFEVFTHSKTSINDLKISYLQLSDSGTYYCGTLTFNTIQFGQGVFLHVKTSLSSRRSVIYQPVNRTLRLGQTMNLSCIVYTDPCAGNTSLFWFRDGSSHPDVMYPSEGNCTNLSDNPRHGKSCTFNLEISSVSSSDAGIYRCALASCGHIVFGNGTKVEVVGDAPPPPVLVYCLCTALTVSIIVLLISPPIMYKLKLKLRAASKGTTSSLRCSAPPDTSNDNAQGLHYAALSLKRSNKPQQSEDSDESVCIRAKSRNK